MQFYWTASLNGVEVESIESTIQADDPKKIWPGVALVDLIYIYRRRKKSFSHQKAHPSSNADK